MWVTCGAVQFVSKTAAKFRVQEMLDTVGRFVQVVARDIKVLGHV